MDGTLGSTNVVLAYLAFRLHGASRLRRWALSTLFLPKVPYYAILDTFSRERFCEVFYRSYADVGISDLEAWSAQAGRKFWDLDSFRTRFARSMITELRAIESCWSAAA